MHERPLLNKRIVVTRAEEQAAELTARLRVLGAEPVLCPAIAIAPPADYAPLDAAIARLDQYDWLIATSVNGVRALFERMDALGQDLAPLKARRIGAIGAATADALAERGLRPHFVPSAYVAESILDEIGNMKGKHILLPRADIAREALVAGLREQGALVDDVAAYRTVPGPGIHQLADQLRAGTLDAITFTSASTVRYLLDGLEESGLHRSEALHLLSSLAVVCIGPITEATAREAGLRIDAVAREYTVKGLVTALVDWYRTPAHA